MNQNALPVAIHPAELLWREMNSVIGPYPDKVVAVHRLIPGTAFFPGGLGLWMPDEIPPEIPTEQVLIVGQDFNSLAVHERAFESRSEVGTSITWKNLLKILDSSNLAPDRCFFTNFYMGLRRVGPETGKFPGARDKGFASRCLKFFHRQLEILRPKLIITLGLEPLRALAKPIFNLPVPEALYHCAEIFPSVKLPHGVAVVVALMHPSARKADVGRRTYHALEGIDAQRSMIEDGIKHSLGL